MEEISLDLISDIDENYIKYSLLYEKYDKKEVERLLKVYKPNIESLDDAKSLLSKSEVNPNKNQNSGSINKLKMNHQYISLSKYHSPGELCYICNKPFKEHFFNKDGKKSHSLNKEYKSVLVNDAENKKYKKKERRNSEIKGNITKVLIPDYTKLCEICLEKKNKNFITFLCGHQFCGDCITSFFKEEIKIGKVPIKCPQKECEFFVDEETVKQNVSDDDFKKYLKFLRRKEIKKIPGAIPCPIPDCESYALLPEKVEEISLDKNIIINIKDDNDEIDNHKKEFVEKNSINFNDEINLKEDDKAIVLKCLDNNHEFCSKCLLPSHPGVQCNLNLENNYVSWKKKNDVHKCPKCGIEIEKTSGCNHMTCSKCNYEFCWICGGKYSSNHFDNPFSPCFQMQYTHSNSIWATNCALKVVKYIGVVILFFLLLGLALCLPGFAMVALFTVFLYEEGVMDGILGGATFFFLGIALNFAGYFIIAGLILLSPAGIIYFFINEYSDEDE